MYCLIVLLGYCRGVYMVHLTEKMRSEKMKKNDMIRVPQGCESHLAEDNAITALHPSYLHAIHSTGSCTQHK
jgi:hypothetical protein